MRARSLRSFGVHAAALVFLLVSASPLYAISFVSPEAANYLPHVDCPHGTPGFTNLAPLEWEYASPLTWPIIEAQVAGEFPSQWGYNLSNDLEGTLTVETYLALDGTASCQHGARMVAKLTGVTNLPPGQKLNWVQVYRERGRSVSRGHEENDWTLDPGNKEVVDGKVEDEAPFYYNSGEVYYDDATKTWTFRDSPTDVILDADVPHPGAIDFITFIAGWDGDYVPGAGGAGSHQITIYGGFSWGYEYNCVPEPLTMVAAMLGVGGLSGYLRRRMAA